MKRLLFLFTLLVASPAFGQTVDQFYSVPTVTPPSVAANAGGAVVGTLTTRGAAALSNRRRWPGGTPSRDASAVNDCRSICHLPG